MNCSSKKIKSSHPWRKWSMKSTFNKDERFYSDYRSIATKESQRGMSRDILTNKLRAKTIMSNEVLAQL